MGFAESSLKAKIALFLCLLGLLMVLVGLATPGWTVVSVLGTTRSVGLFQICVSSSSLSACVSIPSNLGVDWWRACQAMAVIGFFLGAACLGVQGIYVFLKNEMKRLQIVGLALAFATATSCLIAVILWGNYATQFGYSFGLEIVGAILYIAAAVVMILDKVSQ